jgi:arsenite-transporting ATPase
VALAARSAARGARTLLLATDPAGALADALAPAAGGAVPLSGEAREVPGCGALFAMQLDAAAERESFLRRWREVLVTIIDRGTYLARDEIEGFVDAALPGADETMALVRLMELQRDGAWSRVVIDTAPTGHTLRLLELPATLRGAIALLDAMQGKHRFMVRALTRRYRADEADAFLAEIAARADALAALLRDPRRAAMVLVARDEPLVLAETARYARALAALGVPVGAVVANAVPLGGESAASAALAGMDGVRAAPRYIAPLLAEPPRGVAGAERWASALGPLPAGGPPPDFMIAPPPAAGDIDSTRSRAIDRIEAPPVEGMAHSTGAEWHPSDATGIGETQAGREGAREGEPGDAHPAARLLAPELTIVAGKGGVGKTTVACALALYAAAASPPVLLVSTDPAPSIADAMAQAIGDAPVEVEGAPGLVARQMDAAAAFARFRDEYGERVDALFDQLSIGALDAAADRRIMRDLLALAPPGLDEIHALASLGETLAEERYRRVIVDPAPTGHLLRLLESPELALEWSHRILRLMLRYREAVGVGDAAAELLAFARRTRSLSALLRDPARAGVVVVALDEPLVRGESERLIGGVRARGLAVRGVLWNRARDVPRPLSAGAPLPHFLAAPAHPPPRGVRALREWSRRWIPLDPA